jgi:hypothetical protein
MFNGVTLISYDKVPTIDCKQFLQCIIDSMKQRLFDDSEKHSELMSDMRILNPSHWPESPGVRHGEGQITRLRKMFRLSERENVIAMRDFVDTRVLPKHLVQLKNCIESLSCSTAECERGFSQMNLIVIDLRTCLTVQHVSELLFININGPPFELFNPKPYVLSWCINHRNALDNQVKKTQKPNYEADKNIKCGAY